MGEKKAMEIILSFVSLLTDTYLTAVKAPGLEQKTWRPVWPRPAFGLTTSISECLPTNQLVQQGKFCKNRMQCCCPKPFYTECSHRGLRMLPRSHNSLVAEWIRTQLKRGHSESPAKSPCKTGDSFVMWLLLKYRCFEHHMLHLNKANYIYIVKVYSLTNHLFLHGLF